MKERLTAHELCELIDSVFSIRPEDNKLAIIVDIPDHIVKDNDDWKARRTIASEWVSELEKSKSTLHLEAVDLFVYPNVHSNNADLPETAYQIAFPLNEIDCEELKKEGSSHNFKAILKDYQIVLAPTEFSTTAPLKLLSKKFKFRAATMPGFSRKMLPALRIDYGEVNRRVHLIKKLLDAANGVNIQFSTDTGHSYSLHFDIRYRTAHASGGRFPYPGTAGNLPSGESYIVPYEGERKATSQSEGILPVQFEEEIVLYRIIRNRAVEILSKGTFSKLEAEKISKEPAYANIAELGFGVLKDFSIHPIGVTLIDEKLGFHIAFGRSDHFGGIVGAADFSSPDSVIHIDRIYIPETQNRIRIDYVMLRYDNGQEQLLMKDGEYQIF